MSTPHAHRDYPYCKLMNVQIVSPHYNISLRSIVLGLSIRARLQPCRKERREAPSLLPQAVGADPKDRSRPHAIPRHPLPSRKNIPQRLKPDFFAPCATRLKSCPDTKPVQGPLPHLEPPWLSPPVPDHPRPTATAPTPYASSATSASQQHQVEWPEMRRKRHGNKDLIERVHQPEPRHRQEDAAVAAARTGGAAIRG